MLEVRGLVVSYGPVDAVRGIDLEVGEGETVALLGANGAGKSSTLRALSGLVKARGEVRFGGADLRRVSPDAIARAGLVHVPEGRMPFRSLTTEENLLVGTVARGGRTAEFTLADVYDLFPPLTKLRRRGSWTLSGGEQQMMAIGRGLLAAPRLLLLDEPSLGLAPAVVDTVYAALREVREKISVLVVEQNAGLALGLCERAYVLAAGEIAMSGPAAELADRESLLASYLARESDADHDVDHDAVPEVRHEAHHDERQAG
ncbi:ABC transporter ATP-binding protein [Actinomadura decatromicini]|uniref:ABC transporter ATP-binding protein n=1 Tax=Actinomadura decatromicini TaxID=2604572 RepID=A0A5D3F6K0_9ACTN|nr:ABC transporter ATP-binding protein [Actinomadura decatromicini]